VSTEAQTDTDESTPTVADRSDSAENTETLAAQRDLLAAENTRLRELLAASQRSQYRDTALALGGVGVVCLVLGFLTPTASTVLFALGGIGLFSGVLTYFLTPERFISAAIGEQVYAATAVSYDRLCSDLGLSERRLYVPSASPDESAQQASPGWLYVPQDPDDTPPSQSELAVGFVVTETHRGIAVRPTGSGLFETFETALAEPLGTTPPVLCEQLSDALISDFELAETVTYDFDVDDSRGRISFQLSGGLYGDPTQFDHPVVSFLALGVATGLQTPVESTVTETDPLSLTLSWTGEHAETGTEN